MAKELKFTNAMLNGHPGDINKMCRRIVVRAVNQDLIVTATTDGVHAANSYHKRLAWRNPLAGMAVDLGHREGSNQRGTDAKADFQHFLLHEFGPGSFIELFGPDNDACVKNGIRIRLDEGTDLEQAHDTHDHVVPQRLIPLPQPTRKQLKELRAKRRRAKMINKAVKGGAKRYAVLIYDLAEKANITYALGLALVDQESGFDNVYGHDHLPGKPPIWHGKTGRVPVTQTNYAEYKRFRIRNRLAQGVGPVQLTSPGFQDRADHAGGCWKPSANIEVGFDILAGLIKELGLERGIGAYNGGAGNPNMQYAAQVMARRAKWHDVLH